MIRPHGVKGEVKVYPTTDDLHRFSEIDHVYVEQKGKELSRAEVAAVKYQNGVVILKLSCSGSMEDAEALRGADLLITRSQSAPLKDGQFFLADLLDLTVVTPDGEKIGTVEDVLTTGANDVFSIRKSDGKELLLPNIPDCVKSIDLEAKTMVAEILPGL